MIFLDLISDLFHGIPYWGSHKPDQDDHLPVTEVVCQLYTVRSRSESHCKPYKKSVMVVVDPKN